MKMRLTFRSGIPVLLGLIVVGFLTNSIRASLLQGEIVSWPSRNSVVVALAATGLGLWAASTAWLAILGERGAGHRVDFLTAQLGKYLPGGVWQPLGQMGLSASRDVPGTRTLSAIGTYAVFQIIAGTLLLPILVVDSHLPPWVKMSSVGIAVLAVLVLWRADAWSTWLMKFRRTQRVEVVVQQLAAARRPEIIGLLAANMALQGVAFWALVGWSLGLSVVGAYSAAWIIGFLAVPFPAGLGIREGVLMAVLPLASAQIVTASVLQRVVAAITELSFVAASRVSR
ncbi:MAG TPA: hypothetical protein ENH00_14055 [Actinobacteria bacterium]|nr:hypothetical protein BMS3Bbin01_00289 [bacterium BMS3Bbin01]HDH27295.1 hypothetical protein [Actinomycetota bacterium]